MGRAETMLLICFVGLVLQFYFTAISNWYEFKTRTLIILLTISLLLILLYGLWAKTVAGHFLLFIIHALLNAFVNIKIKIAGATIFKK